MTQYLTNRYIGIIAIAALLVWHLWAGLSAMPRTLFRSAEDMVDTMFVGAGTLFIPVAAALISGARLTAELDHRFIASTRARTPIRAYLLRHILVACATTAILFFAFGAVITAVGYWIAPSLFPEMIDPHGYGLSSADAVRADAVLTHPLSQALDFGPFVYVLAVGGWLAASGVTFALVTLVSVLTLSRPAIALTVPLALYLVQSVILQVLDRPAYSFMIAMPYPSGLQEFPLSAAIIPVAITVALSIIALVGLLLRAPKNPRFS